MTSEIANNECTYDSNLSLAKSVSPHCIATLLCSQDEAMKYLKRQITEAQRQITQLFIHLAPDCVPFDHLSGVISQLDNAICGVRAERDAARFEVLKAQVGLDGAKARADQLAKIIKNFRALWPDRQDVLDIEIAKRQMDEALAADAKDNA